ncbi:hypothetical protein MKW98_029803 [Papaver atlanticum]|uniref:Uncharacterized protein n=1 Tax=Papaver atlanticum TaxID=357466 RepID=A0AAD4XPG7_9MAGN|nr:hypothetical protein MKW98_029803 [Papaver atlanticum]
MANRLRGFARMLSTAKNSTIKEGFSRRVSSSAGKSTKNHKGDAPMDYVSEQMKEIFGDIDYGTLTYAERKKIMTRYVNREVDIEALKILSMSLAIGLTVSSVVGYFSGWWYPFKDAGEQKFAVDC